MARVGATSRATPSAEPAVLGRGLKVVGRVRGEGDLRVEAEIEGDLAVSGTLHLDEAASVRGSVDADSLVVAGSLEGEAHARHSVSILATGHVRGDVHAPEVTLEPGGGLDGRIEAAFELPKNLS